MLLHTKIPPRTDGTVRVDGLDGETYVFEGDGAGALACDVTDAATAAQLLAHGLCFEPVTAEPAKPEGETETETETEGEGEGQPPAPTPPPAPKRSHKAKPPALPPAAKPLPKTGA